MILYFDTFITNTPLNKKESPLDDVRTKHPLYAMPDKVDITKYSLASYSVFPWTNVLIKYELEDKTATSEFDNFIHENFPNAQIEHERSDSQSDHIDSLATLEKWNDPWIFYSPNNDHPLLISETADISYINRLITRAEYWKSLFPFVSIIYSHLEEYISAPYPDKANHRYFGRDMVLLYEDDEAIVCLRKHGDFNSIQIAHIDTFAHWFTSTDLSSTPVRRCEDLHNVKVENHVLIIPKKRLCAHFDGYEHMQNTASDIQQDLSPVLFIPPGFFDKKIKIAYGYNTRKDDYVNINPSAKKYCFRDSVRGTDLKIALSEIPLFWRDRISEVDVNLNTNHLKLNRAARNNFSKQQNPWKITSRGLNFENPIFQIKRFLRFIKYTWITPLQ